MRKTPGTNPRLPYPCMYVYTYTCNCTLLCALAQRREREADSGRCGFFQTHHFKVEVGTSELACRVKALAVKSDVLSSIPGTHTVEGRNQLSIVVL